MTVATRTASLSRTGIAGILVKYGGADWWVNAVLDSRASSFCASGRLSLKAASRSCLAMSFVPVLSTSEISYVDCFQLSGVGEIDDVDCALVQIPPNKVSTQTDCGKTRIRWLAIKLLFRNYESRAAEMAVCGVNKVESRSQIGNMNLILAVPDLSNHQREWRPIGGRVMLPTPPLPSSAAPPCS